jgi:putative tryptophan/tyrosine transport system substrate-binding protein
MRRRDFIAILVGTAARVSAASAQPQQRVIGVLHVLPPDKSLGYVALQQKLAELGYVGERAITVEYRWSGQPERLVVLAAELAAMKVEAIVTADLPTTRAARQATGAVPIIAAVLKDNPVAVGLVASLARPGGNVTGWTLLAPEISGKRLEVLRKIVPDLSRVAVLWINRAAAGEQLRLTDQAARALGIAIVPVEVNAPDDLDGAFQAMARERAEAVDVLTAAQFFPLRERIAELGLQHRLATIAGLDGFVRLGGLVTYGPSVYEGWREAAIFVSKIIRGVKPADLPIGQPTRFELGINLRTAESLGLTIAPALLARADEVIE